MVDFNIQIDLHFLAHNRAAAFKLFIHFMPKSSRLTVPEILNPAFSIWNVLSFILPP